jgi:hypothetical protein
MRESVCVSRRVFIFLLYFAFLSGGGAAQVSILTHHGDNARTGANLDESILNISNVNPKTFGKLTVRSVDGNIYAQPLVVAGVRAANRPDPTNLAIVATERNNVYAFDADDVNPDSERALVWKTGPSTLGASVATETLVDDIAQGVCSDLTPDIGITATPAIQITNEQAPREGVVFVVAKSKAGAEYHYKLFALALSDGRKIGETEIRGEVKGRGFGSVGGKVRFDPKLQLNRPGLLLVGKRLYVAFGGHCDMGDYHGWLFSYDVSNPKSMKRAGVLNTTPNGPEQRAGKGLEGGAGIWMSGEGPSADGDGAVYFVTGNGTNDNATELGDSVVKAAQQGKQFNVAGRFTPRYHKLLQTYDIDLGSTGAVLLPESHRLITGSKDGHMLLLDRDNLGDPQPVDSIQVTQDLVPGMTHYGIHGTPALWPRGDELFVYTAGTEDPVRQFRMVRGAEDREWKFDPAGARFRTSSAIAPYPKAPDGLSGRNPREHEWTPGGFLTLSANGSNEGSGILWVTMPFDGSANHRTVRGQLRALDASDVSKPELWNSENTGDENDRVGMFAKFVPPTVANGKVYVATFQREGGGDQEVTTGTGQTVEPETRAALVIYGLR